MKDYRFISYLIICLFALFACTKGYGQKVLWASEVVEFSSEKKSNAHYHHLHPFAYKAIQVIDEPNIMPGSEGTAHAWTPRKPDEDDSIKVKFKEAIHVKQIVIAEAINPSSIYKLYLYDTLGTEYFIREFIPKPVPLHGRLLHVFIQQTPYLANAVKIVMDGSKVPGYNGIDAIGISDSNKPVEVNVTVASGFQSAHSAEMLSDSVNSKFKEIKPIFSPDGKRMYFSRINHPHNSGGHKDPEDIWYSDLDTVTGKWQMAKNIGEPLNNNGPNFICSITPRGRYYDLLLGNMYYKGKMIAGLSITTRHEFGYTEPEHVFIEDDENLSPYANYFLANNEQAILMSVHRRGGFGGRDLYVTFRQKNHTWSRPLNLGDVINTAEEETSPYLAYDNKTLYFSSEGHLGYGMEDVFVSHRLDDTWTNWSEPENLGPAVNSSEDDIFFHLAPDNKFGYYIRGDKDNSDIYRLELPLFQLPDPVITVQGKVREASTLKPLGNTLIQFRDIHLKRTVSQLRSDSITGAYKVILPTGTNYRVFAYSNEENLVSSEDEMVEAEYIYENDTLNKDILLYPVEDGRIISLNALLYGRILNGNTLEPIPEVKVVFKDLRNNTLIDEAQSDSSGHYQINIPIGNEYNLSFYAEDYISIENEVIDLSESFESDTINKDIMLYPIEVGQRVSLDNIYFDFDKSELRPASKTQLEQVFRFLEDNPKIKIQFDGHTCSIGQADYNQQLSEERALAVNSYMVQQGIKSKRLSSVGYGESVPDDNNLSRTGRAKNRRVEFVILEK